MHGPYPIPHPERVQGYFLHRWGFFGAYSRYGNRYSCWGVSVSDHDVSWWWELGDMNRDWYAHVCSSRVPLAAHETRVMARWRKPHCTRLVPEGAGWETKFFYLYILNNFYPNLVTILVIYFGLTALLFIKDILSRKVFKALAIRVTRI